MQNISLTNTNKNKLLSPKLDVVFQTLFGEVGNENITKRFLEAILNKKIDSIDLSQNPILRREEINDKLGILDVIAKIDNNELCNIEMQMTSQKNIVERLLHYWSGTYHKQLRSGNNYNKLNKTISILIANFNLPILKDLPFQTTWKIIEEEYRKTILTDFLEIRIIELPKIINLCGESDELLDWLFFLENPSSERVMEKMKNNKELKQANEKLIKISSNEHLQKIAEWRQRAIWEENTAREDGYNDGREAGIKDGLKEGIEQGIEQKTYDLIKLMLANNESIEKIRLYSGYSLEQIKKIKNELSSK